MNKTTAMQMGKAEDKEKKKRKMMVKKKRQSTAIQ